MRKININRISNGRKNATFAIKKIDLTKVNQTA